MLRLEVAHLLRFQPSANYSHDAGIAAVREQDQGRMAGLQRVVLSQEVDCCHDRRELQGQPDLEEGRLLGISNLDP